MSPQKSKHGGKRPGAGRKPGSVRGVTKKPVAVMLSREAIDIADEIAARRNCSRSAAITRALLEYGAQVLLPPDIVLDADQL